jgi:hypothetical protein
MPDPKLRHGIRAQIQRLLRYLIQSAVHGVDGPTDAGATKTQGVGNMATTTDYDAPRRSTIEDADTESLDAIKTARAEAQSPDVDLDESDAGESIDLPGADLSGEELTMAVIPKQADEFTCTCCFLVQHRSRLASRPGEPSVCTDCA